MHYFFPVLRCVIPQQQIGEAGQKAGRLRYTDWLFLRAKAWPPGQTPAEDELPQVNSLAAKVTPAVDVVCVRARRPR